MDGGGWSGPLAAAWAGHLELGWRRSLVIRANQRRGLRRAGTPASGSGSSGRRRLARFSILAWVISPSLDTVGTARGLVSGWSGGDWTGGASPESQSRTRAWVSARTRRISATASWTRLKSG